MISSSATVSGTDQADSTTQQLCLCFCHTVPHAPPDRTGSLADLGGPWLHEVLRLDCVEPPSVPSASSASSASSAFGAPECSKPYHPCRQDMQASDDSRAEGGRTHGAKWMSEAMPGICKEQQSGMGLPPQACPGTEVQCEEEER